MQILQYNEVTMLTGLEQFLFALPGGDPANTINSANLAAYVLSLNAYATGGTNIGNTGVHVYAGISGGLLRFNNIAPASNKITATLDGSNNILIDVDVGNLLLSTLGGNIGLTSQVTGELPVANGGTAGNDGPSARLGIGAASAGANTDITSLLLSQTGLVINSAGAGNLVIVPDESLSIDRNFNIILGDADRTLTMTGDASLEGVNTGDQTITLTGDAAGSGTASIAVTIAANAVDLSKMAQMSSQEFIGRNTAGTGDPEYIDKSTALGILGININSTRSYSSQTLAFSTPRTPSATNDTFVIVTVQIVATTLQTGEVDVQVDTGSGYVTIAKVYNDNEAGTTATFNSPITFIVPANTSYQLLSSGTATVSITSIFELTF